MRWLVLWGMVLLTHVKNDPCTGAACRRAGAAGHGAGAAGLGTGAATAASGGG